MFCDVVDCSPSCCTALLRATQAPKNEGRWFWFCVQSTPDSKDTWNVQRSIQPTNAAAAVSLLLGQQQACSATAYFVPFPTVTQFKTLLLRSFQKKKYFLNALAVLLPYLKKRSFQKIKTLLLSNSNSASQCTDN